MFGKENLRLMSILSLIYILLPINFKLHQTHYSTIVPFYNILFKDRYSPIIFKNCPIIFKSPINFKKIFNIKLLKIHLNSLFLFFVFSNFFRLNSFLLNQILVIHDSYNGEDR